MTLDELSDRAAVEDVIVKVFVATDQRDWQAVQACFAEAVLFDMTSLAGGEPTHLTPARITQAWEEGLAPIEALHHQIGNVQVNLDGNQASCACYGIALHHRKVASGRNTRTFVGTYDFHLTRDTSHRWHIDVFRFNLKFLEGNLELHAEEAGSL